MFKYDGTNEKLRLATETANKPKLLAEVKRVIKITDFEMSTADSAYLADKFIAFLESDYDVIVKGYRKRFSKALAYFTFSRPRDININESMLNRSNGSIVGTEYHEAAHLFDNLDTTHQFGHGSNSSVGKQNTFPYKVGSIAKKIVDTGNYSVEPTPMPTYKPTRWTRVKMFFSRLLPWR